MNFKNIDTLKNSVETEKQELSEIEEIIQRIEESGEKYIYILSVAKYYWVSKKSFFTHSETAQNLLISPKQLTELRKYYIEEYIGFVYKQGGQEGYFNLLDENQITLPSEIPEIHSDIQELFETVCGKNKQNIEYLHKAVLWKYNNINSPHIPAVVFYGAGGSGKGTFITLLSQIFGEDNVLINLGQQDLISSFNTFQGDKIALEYAEISSNNASRDIGMINKLKNIICAKTITINLKHVRQYQVDNIAWFIISSNNSIPIRLDPKEVGNRRFSIIHSPYKLTDGARINATLKNKSLIANYLAWLHETYAEVLEYTKLEALDNEDKRILEDLSQNEVNNFWEWVEEVHPDFTGRKTLGEVYDLLEVYRIEYDLITENIKKYFWNNSKFPRKKMRFPQLNGRVGWGVEIPIKIGVNTSTKSTDVSNVDM